MKKIFFALFSIAFIFLAMPLAGQTYFGHTAITNSALGGTPLGVYPVPDPELGDQEVVVRKRVFGLHFDGGNDYFLGSQTWDAELTLSVEAQNGSGTAVQVQEFTFELDPQHTEGHYYLDFTPIWRDVETFEISVVSYSATHPLQGNPFRLNLDLYEEKGHGLIKDDGVTEIIINQATFENAMCYPTDVSCVNFSWSPGTDIHFDSYDLEILKVEPDVNGDVEIDWRKASTIEVNETEYSLTLAEGTGWYYWRVRPIATIYKGGREDYRNYGEWSAHPANGTSISSLYGAPTTVDGVVVHTPVNAGFIVNSGTISAQNRLYFNQFDEGINWVYGKVLTEGSRQSEQISFADGLNIARQQQTKLYSKDYVMATQSVPDYSARPALQTLPAPVADKDEAFLAYRSDFFTTTTTSGDAYSAADYDDDGKIYTPNAIDDALTDFTPNYYYSDNNNDLGDMASYIPDAGGVPYVRTLFYNDATGRVYRQAAPGATMKLDESDQSRNIITMYGSVAPIELVRMFGEEAPEDRKVYKTVTLDPNGVASVTYTGNSGQVLATCLDNGSNSVESLLDVADESSPGSSFTAIYEFGPGVPNESDWSNTAYETFVILGDQEHMGAGNGFFKEVKINYEFSPKSFGITCDNICQSCDYEITLDLSCPLDATDPEKNVTLTTSILGQDLWNYDDEFCGTVANPTILLKDFSWTITGPGGAAASNFSNFVNGTFYLPTGNYNLNKRIKTNNPVTVNSVAYPSVTSSLKRRLELARQSWTAQDNCCGPITVDVEWDCDGEDAPGCNPEDKDVLAADLWPIVQNEMNATLPDQGGVGYTTILNNSPTSVSGSYTQSTLKGWVETRLEAGIPCEEIWACFQAYGAILDMNISQANSGAGATPAWNGTGLPPQTPMTGYNPDFDLLESIDDCIGYPLDPCEQWEEIVLHFGGISSASGTPIYDVAIPDQAGSPTGQQFANYSCVHTYFQYNLPATGSGTVTLGRADTRLGLTLSEAVTEVCKCINAVQVSTTPPSGSVTMEEILNGIEKECIQSCEDKRVTYEAAIDAYVSEHNANASPARYLDTDPNWEDAQDIFGNTKDCMLEALLADCREKCRLDNHRDLANNPSSPPSSSLVEAEAENLEDVMNRLPIVAPFENPGIYGTTSLSASQDDLVKTIEDELTYLINNLGTSSGTLPHPINYQTSTPASGTYGFTMKSVPFMSVLTPSKSYTLDVLVGVIWDAANPTIIEEVSVSLYCKNTRYAYWSFMPTDGCVEIQTLLPNTFQADPQLVSVFFDSRGQLHMVRNESLCLGDVEADNICTEFGSGIYSLQVTGGTVGDHFNVEIENTVTGQVQYISGTPIQVQSTSATTADEIVSNINGLNSTTGFYAHNKVGGTSTTVVTIVAPDNLAGDYTDWIVKVEPTVSVIHNTTTFQSCVDPLHEILDNNPCVTTTTNTFTENCPLGMTAVEQPNVIEFDEGNALDERDLARQLEGFWEGALDDVYRGPFTSIPQFPQSHFTPSSTTLYEEKSWEFFLEVNTTGGGTEEYKYIAYAGAIYDATLDEVQGIYLGVNQLSACASAPGTIVSRLLVDGCTLVSSSYVCNELYPSLDPNSLPLYFRAKQSILDIDFNTTNGEIEITLASGSNHQDIIDDDIWVVGTTTSGGGHQSFVSALNASFATANECTPTVACEVCIGWEDREIAPSVTLEELDPCEEAYNNFVASQVGTQLINCLRTQQEAVLADYKANCLNGIEDDLSIEFDLNYHQYTLYYYDRANNLIRTVPPQGFTPHTLGEAFKHDMHTEYKYNSIGQMEKQITPDGGVTQFWYNAAGQMIASQDAAQKDAGNCSYTTHDNLGRIIEVGELVGFDPTAHVTGLIVPQIWEHPEFPANVLSGSITVREVVTTTYSKKFPEANYKGEAQTHTRNRITNVMRDADGDGIPETQTYFSYDPHGNVVWCIQELPDLGKKYVRYEYDLVSGNVLQVVYNEGTPEEFRHKYTYDEDNRITTVKTSTDGYVWEGEAAYNYYLHGPIARKVIGEDKVQGCDYVYSIEGYIKAINQPELDVEKDPGADGVVGSQAGGFTISSIGSSGNIEILIDGTSVFSTTYLSSTITQLLTNIESGISGGYTATKDGNTLNITPPTGSAGYHIVEITGSTPVTDVRHISAGVPDEFAMELGYYEDDYTRTGSALGTDANNTLNPWDGTNGVGLASSGYNLYNGNISWWATNTRSGQTAQAGIKPLDGKVNLYKYDKLNRIRQADMHAYDAGGGGGFPWSTHQGSFRERFTFDRNGNILTAQRAGHDGNNTGTPATSADEVGDPSNGYLIDDLEYEYGSLLTYGLGHTNTTNGVTNRLDRVVEGNLNPNDPVWGQWVDDLGDQTANNKNYYYDSEGKLIEDKSEGLEIEWNILNKVKKITKSDPVSLDPQSLIEFEYDAMGNRVLKRVSVYNGSGVIDEIETTYYVADASGNTMAIYGSTWELATNSTTFRLREQPIYGSDRLGMYTPEAELYTVKGQPGNQTLLLPSTDGALSRLLIAEQSGAQTLETGRSDAWAVSTPVYASESWNPGILLDDDDQMELGVLAKKTGSSTYGWQLIDGSGALVGAPFGTAERGLWAKPVLMRKPAEPGKYYMVYYPTGAAGTLRTHQIVEIDAALGTISAPQDLTPGLAMGGRLVMESFTDGSHRLFGYTTTGSYDGYEIVSIDITGLGITEPSFLARIEAPSAARNKEQHVLDISPLGDKIALAYSFTNIPLPGLEYDLAVWNLEGNCAKIVGEPKAFKMAGGSATGISFTKDGRFIYFTENNNTNPASPSSNLGRIDLHNANTHNVHTFAGNLTDVSRTPAEQIITLDEGNGFSPFTIVENPSEVDPGLLTTQTPIVLLATNPNGGFPLQRVRKVGTPQQGDRLPELRNWMTTSTGGPSKSGFVDMDFDPAPVTVTDPYNADFSAGSNIAIGEDRFGTPILKLFTATEIGGISTENVYLLDKDNWPIAGGINNATSTMLTDPNSESIIAKAPGNNEVYHIITGRAGQLYLHTADMQPVSSISGTVLQKNVSLTYIDNTGATQNLTYDNGRNQYALALYQDLAAENGVKLFTAVNRGTEVAVYQHSVTEAGIEPGKLVKSFVDKRVRQIRVVPGTGLAVVRVYRIPTGKQVVDLKEMHISPDGSEVALSLTSGGGQYLDGKLHHRIERFRIVEEVTPAGPSLEAQYVGTREMGVEKRPQVRSSAYNDLDRLLKYRTLSWDFSPGGSYVYRVRKAVPGTNPILGTMMPRLALDRNQRFIATTTSANTETVWGATTNDHKASLRRAFDDKLYMSAMSGNSFAITNYHQLTHWSTTDDADVATVQATKGTQSLNGTTIQLTYGLPLQPYRVFDCVSGGGAVLAYRASDIRTYEMKDHLGNVRTVVSDLVNITVPGSGIVSLASPEVKSWTDYYAYGYAMPGRKWNSGGYRYGFNGKENDGEVKGDGLSHDFGARIYDPRLGRWFSVDPKFEFNIPFSPYIFAEQNPIALIDPNGEDSEASIHGNTITISTKIYIYGEGANSQKAAEMQKQIMDVWGAGGTYIDPVTNKSYTLNFEVQVEYESSTENADVTPSTNLVKLAPKNRIPRGRSFVRGRFGLWDARPKDIDIYAHEAGHFLGIDDMYYEYIFPTYDIGVQTSEHEMAEDGEVMSKKANDGESGNVRLTQVDIDLFGAFVLERGKQLKKTDGIPIRSGEIKVFSESYLIQEEQRRAIDITYPEHE